MLIAKTDITGCRIENSRGSSSIEAIEHAKNMLQCYTLRIKRDAYMKYLFIPLNLFVQLIPITSQKFLLHCLKRHHRTDGEHQN